MNKMFTTAMAIAAVAGLASAAIETTAGYKEVSVSGTEFIGTPFASFTDTDVAATIGDIIGANGDKITVISAAGKKLFTATYSSSADPTGWYELEGCSNSYPLARGTAVQFVAGPSADNKLFMAGSLASEDVNVTLGAQNNFIANASAFSGTTLGDFVVSGDSYKPMGSDYFLVDGQKVVYLNQATAAKAGLSAGWYLKSALKTPKTAVSQNSTPIAVGKGFRCVLTTGATITVPGN